MNPQYNMAEKHYGLINRVINTYFAQYLRVSHKLLSREDMLQEGMLGVLRAMQDYDPSRGEFSTYAHWWIRQRISWAMEREKRQLDIAHRHGRRRLATCEDVTDAADFKAEVMRRLPPRARLVFELHYWDGLTYSEIAGRLGCSKQNVYSVIRQNVARLREVSITRKEPA